MGTFPFGFNRAMVHQTFLVEGFEPLELGRHRRLVSTLSAKNIGNLLKITNSKYVSTADTGALEMFPDYLPRAFVVPQARFVADDERVLELLAEFDPSSTVLISGKGTDLAGTPLPSADGGATVLSYSSDRVEIRTRVGQDGYLVLSDTYYPGWTARVDGAEVEVMRANYDFRAVFLPKGEHVVVFSYFPRLLWMGAMISLATLLALGILPAWFCLKRVR